MTVTSDQELFPKAPLERCMINKPQLNKKRDELEVVDIDKLLKDDEDL